MVIVGDVIGDVAMSLAMWSVVLLVSWLVKLCTLSLCRCKTLRRRSCTCGGRQQHHEGFFIQGQCQHTRFFIRRRDYNDIQLALFELVDDVVLAGGSQ